MRINDVNFELTATDPEFVNSVLASHVSDGCTVKTDGLRFIVDVPRGFYKLHRFEESEWIGPTKYRVVTVGLQDAKEFPTFEEALELAVSRSEAHTRPVSIAVVPDRVQARLPRRFKARVGQLKIEEGPFEPGE